MLASLPVSVGLADVYGPRLISGFRWNFAIYSRLLRMLGMWKDFQSTQEFDRVFQGLLPQMKKLGLETSASFS